jgi:hypothetical protein
MLRDTKLIAVSINGAVRLRGLCAIGQVWPKRVGVATPSPMLPTQRQGRRLSIR